MDRVQIENILSNHVPEKALSDVVDLLIQNQVYLNISKSRSSKYGDFKVPSRGGQAKLSVNHDLNPYAFLITLLHEIAHLLVWRNHQYFYSRIKPHGKEWKIQFKSLMRPYLISDIFPEPLLNKLKRHMLNPKASSSSDIQLMSELRKFDSIDDKNKNLAELSIGDIFLLKKVRFRIIKKNRTRYLCEDIMSKKRFLIHSLAQVEIVH